MSETTVELEIKIAYQDKVIADLDEVVRAFATRVEQLERKVEQLQDRVDAAAELPVGPHDEKPPHY